MPLVDVVTAKLHLRVTHDSEDALLQTFIAAAERYVVAFLGRNVYATQEEVDEAVAGAPAALEAAATAYEAAMDAAGAVEVSDARTLAEENALRDYRRAMNDGILDRRAMVLSDNVKLAILLTVASLWEHRGEEDAVVGVPAAARTFLWLDRS
jgi:hypothetical protein